MLPSEMIKEFHKAFNLDMSDTPKLVNPALTTLRLNLIAEEYEELYKAVAEDDLVEIADALADIIYIAYGTALVYGIPIDDIFEEVHASNMKKLGPDGKPLYREDGKVAKPEGWQPPNIKRILEERIK